MLLSLPAHAWVPLVDTLTAAEVAALRMTHPKVRYLVAQAQCLVAERAKKEAGLLTRVYCAGSNGHGQCQAHSHTIVALPTPRGYVVVDGAQTTHVCRRMFVHQFPAMCCLMLAGCHAAAHRMESFLAFPSLGPLGPLARDLAPLTIFARESPVELVWTTSKMVTRMSEYPTSQWHQLCQAHARFLVNFRLGRPKTRRTRRARRWTKVASLGRRITGTRDARQACDAPGCVACVGAGAGSAEGGRDAWGLAWGGEPSSCASPRRRDEMPGTPTCR